MGMDCYSNDIDEIWDSLLSRQSEAIIKAFNSLEEMDKRAVINHLQRMISEEGWHPEQVASAKAALNALEN